MENRAFNYITETSIVICPRYNRERDNDKNEKKGRGEVSKEENRKKRIDGENWIYKELAMRNTLFARAERRRRVKRKMVVEEQVTALGPIIALLLAISCITR